MKRTIALIWLCFMFLTAQSQLDSDELTNYISDIKMYGSAMDDITKKGNDTDGIATLTKLIDNSEKKQGYPIKELASYYSARALGWLHLKQFEQAENDVKKALALSENTGVSGKSNRGNFWYLLAIVYYNQDRQEETMAAADSCVAVTTEYYGRFHQQTEDAYSMRSNLAGFFNKKEVALEDRQVIFGIIQKNVERNFAYLTASERSAYWNKHIVEASTMFGFAHKMKEYYSRYTDALYDQQLLSKGLLLAAENALQQAIDSDSAMKAAYQKVRMLRRKASDSNTSPKVAEAAALEADRQERQLGTTANDIHQFLNFLKIHVDDVRGNLKEGDIAIEFVDYRVGKDSTMYAALVLSPKWQHARFIPLAEEKEIEAHSNQLYSYIWQPVIDALDYIPQTIYFAPSGLLYQLPIESDAMDDGRLMCDTYNMFRLSSTRWLAYKHSLIEGKDAVIYGGITYGTDSFISTNSAERGAVEGIAYLPGTKTEAETIMRTINDSGQSHLHAEALIGDQGTEASFKALSGQRKRIAHIATHGFYQKEDESVPSLENALQRSGLFFAGADSCWESGQIIQGADDGVLTASEISTLDLRGLDIVVLSACQTGKGDISPDGVFGLQRGFKKAGVNCILMSLWKVDDEATCLLMTEFYQNWIGAGKTKRDALELAKRKVRSHKEKGWDAPKYWASFIILDAF